MGRFMSAASVLIIGRAAMRSSRVGFKDKRREGEYGVADKRERASAEADALLEPEVS
jgi:hypothetical protein